jgi:two-component system, OmpR family, alkaline phosphatase synthesis response regulator PhoP
MGKKLLIIDDEKDILELTSRFLKSRGYDIIALTNGDEAYRITQSQHPDLICTDMMLPGKFGNEICREIKSDPALKHIPVIITSGRMDEGKTVNGKPDPFGADCYLIKPFEIDDLLAAIEQLLNPKK